MLQRLGDWLATKNQTIHRFVIWNRKRIDNLKERRRLREHGRYRFDFCVLGIMKNESLNIIEWIEHYLWQGAATIYLIDNGSTDETIKIIQPHLNSGKVKLVVLKKRWQQRKHYWTAIKRFGILRKSKWLLVADIDEFWFTKSGVPIADTLKDMDHVDLIYANWTIFGNNGYVDHPDSLRLNLTNCAPELGSDLHTKWIVRTSAVRRYNQIHVHKIRGVRSSHTYTKNEIFQINHYYTQSEQFWKTVKMTRGDVYNPLNDDLRQIDQFKQVNASCTFTDTLLKDYVEQEARANMSKQGHLHP